MSLTEHEEAVLALEGQWFARAGSKEQVVRDLFGLTPTAYYVQLDRLLDRPEALAHSPVVVKRLRALREQRQRVRASRRLPLG